MPMSRTLSLTIVAWASYLVLGVPSYAESLARAGSITVAQATQMLDQAPANRTAQQVLIAYLGGVGEAAGVMIELGDVPCARPLTLTTEDVRGAIAGAPSSARANQVAATPLVVRDMLERAGCHRR